MRRRRHHPAILFLIFFSLAGAAADNDNDNDAAADPAILATVCGGTAASNPESFDVSFVNTLELIYQNVTRSGFGAASSGSNNNVVSALGQCMAYLSPTACQLCYARSRVKLPHCLPATAGRIFLDGCFLRYGGGHQDITNAATDADDTAVCTSNATVQAREFAVAAAKLVRNVTAAAPAARDYYYAAEGEGEGPRVYAAAQCWRSLNASACAACVASARDRVVGRCLPRAEEGWGLNAGCVVRYSTRPFFYLPANAVPALYPVMMTTTDPQVTTRHITIVVLASVLSALGVIGIAFLWTRMRSSSRNVDLHDDMDGSGEIIRAIAASHLSFKYQELRRATDDFNQVNKLGQGGYGSVYKGVLPDGREVAVKRLFFNTRQWAQQFFNEVRMVSQVQHKNLVKLVGCSVEGPESLLVYEYLCNTSLDHYLFVHLTVAFPENLTNLAFLQIWKHYKAGTLMELLDPNLRDQCSEEEALKVFHVGLLCAQASPNLRPPMWKVVEMLNSRDKVLPQPSQPPFINVKGSNAKSDSSGSSSLHTNSDNSPFSLNQLSVSGVHAR
ncbi:hypothetical protein PR202_ga11140 [Eleusine coracana subsp. coracana]|uniref:Uncharacterized protein n=1 Tax=Eleusine coracana subsp. coracana TaxID=191504 RepID=A0AAV5C8K1_ELECO|nr:hypothetical protein PR202_ga11140 [Eleusine coracana subsp. coracana]